MGKLSGYCINQALALSYDNRYSIPNHMGMTRKAWDTMPFDRYDKIRLPILYSFEDRYDKGISLHDVIEFFENFYNHNHPFIIKTLYNLQEAEFEGYSVSTISNSFLVWLFSVEHKVKTKEIGLFSTRYGAKKFRKFKKAFDSWLDEEQQYAEFMRTQVLPGYNRRSTGGYDDE